MTQPLTGRTVLVTRPAHQAAALAQVIRAAGGTAFEFPAIEVEAVALDELSIPLARLAEADIAIFISPNAAQFGIAAIRARDALPGAVRVFAVGPGTARALQAQGVSGVITPDGQDSEALLALPQLQDVAGKRVVIVRGVGGRMLLAETLRQRGAQVALMECYRRVRPQADAAPLLARWQSGGIDAVTVTSAETLHNLAALVGDAGLPLLLRTPLFAPHEKIAEAAHRLGIAHVIATPGGDAGLVDGLINWFRNKPMNDTLETPVPQFVPQPAAASTRTRFSPVALVAMLFAALAMVAAGWSWFDGRERIRDLKTELGRQLAESGKDISETRLLARNADDAMRQVSEKVAHIESQMVTSQQQQLSLEALYKDLSQGRDQWTLAEIEQVLLTAARQLQLAGNVKAAIIALEGADTRLQRLDKPQFTALRRAIAADLAKLRAVPSLDEVGASARIEALVARHADWPLVSAQVSEAAPPPRASAQATDFGQELWNELKRLVQIRRVESNEAVLLPPDQAYFLRENLRLRLLSARLALLTQDQAAFQADLHAVSETLSRYFNTRDAGVADALKEVERLSGLQVAQKLPGIDASLAALETYKDHQ
jgi:uroporphyrin-3 C-methyltransferase